MLLRFRVRWWWEIFLFAYLKLRILSITASMILCVFSSPIYTADLRRDGWRRDKVLLHASFNQTPTANSMMRTMQYLLLPDFHPIRINFLRIKEDGFFKGDWESWIGRRLRILIGKHENQSWYVTMNPIFFWCFKFILNPNIMLWP